MANSRWYVFMGKYGYLRACCMAARTAAASLAIASSSNSMSKLPKLWQGVDIFNAAAKEPLPRNQDHPRYSQSPANYFYNLYLILINITTAISSVLSNIFGSYHTIIAIRLANCFKYKTHHSTCYHRH